MAFEPLQTDETLDQPAPKKRDMDTLMLMGCGAFVATSLLTYGVSILPFLINQDIWSLTALAKNAGIGIVLSLVITVLAARRFGIAGGCGAVAGALTQGIFLYLRLQQTFLAGDADQAPKPEYPPVFQLVLPLTWILLTALTAILSTTEARSSLAD